MGLPCRGRACPCPNWPKANDIIVLARDPGRDRGTRLRVGPYFLSQNINQLNFQCTYYFFRNSLYLIKDLITPALL
jgi:hypothetical protein